MKKGLISFVDGNDELLLGNCECDSSTCDAGPECMCQAEGEPEDND